MLMSTSVALVVQVMDQQQEYVVLPMAVLQCGLKMMVVLKTLAKLH